MKNFIFKFIIIILILNFSNVFADEQKEVIIIGNSSIDNEVIFSILEDISFDNSDDINIAIKRLYQTGYFKDVNINKIDNTTTISLIENIKINSVNFMGNERFKSEEILSTFKEDTVFKYYNQNLINQFSNDLKELYHSFGYNMVDITHHYSEVLINDIIFYDLKFDIKEGKISKINKVYFKGNENFDYNSLISVIKSKPRNSLLFFTNRNFKSNISKKDVFFLKEFYQQNGYKNVSVTLKTEFISKKNKFNIYFYIDEGTNFTFDNISLNLDNLDLTQKQIDELNLLFDEYIEKNISDNLVYNTYYFDLIESLLTNYLFNEGLSFFNIAILEKTIESNVSIMFDIKITKPKYVGVINIYGNTRTLDRVIRRELEFAEGDSITDYLIAASNKNLQRLGIFQDININEISVNNELVNIDVNVTEQQTGEFQVGLSVGSLSGATFITSLNEKNIGGAGRSVNLAVNTSESNMLYKLHIIEPHVFNRKINLIYGVDFSKNDYSTSSYYKLNKFNSDFGFSYFLAKDLRHKISLGYTLKDYEITNRSLASSAIIAADGNNAEINLKNSFTYNKLNSFLRPTSGNFTNFENIFSPITNSDDGYIKSILTYKKYLNFNKKRNILSVQSKLANITSFQNTDILTDDKFSLGGRWLRGFDIYGAGPRNSSKSYIGGNNLFVTKIDLKRSINHDSDNPIDLTLFTDFGTVFGNKTDPTDSEESFRSSYGFAINFYSPIGPIGFSWGFPISDESYDIKRMFLFSIGNIN